MFRTAEDFAGKALARITRGNDRVIYEIPISDNTADTIFIDDVDVIAQVQAGDLVEVVIPGARIEPAAPDLTLTFVGKGSPEFFLGSANFQRLSLANAITRGVFSFDRCELKIFCYGGLPMFVNCFSTSGDVIAGTSGAPEVPIRTVPGGTDPLNTSVAMTKQVAGNSARYFFSPGETAGSASGGGGYHFHRNLSVRALNAVNGEGLMRVRGGIHVKFFGDLILSAKSAGTGSLLSIDGNSVCVVPERTAVDVVDDC